MLEVTDYNNASPLIVGLVGMEGTGKSSLGGGLQGLSACEIDPLLCEEGVSDIQNIRMREIILWHKREVFPGQRDLSLRELADYHRTVRDAGQAEVLLDRLKALRAGVFIIDAVHHEEDAAIFKKNGWFLLGLAAPHYVCAERVAHDDNDEKHQLAVEDFITYLKQRGIVVDDEQLEALLPQARRRAADNILQDALDSPYERRQDRIRVDSGGTVPRRREGLAVRMTLADAIIDAEGDKTEVVERAVVEIRKFAAIKFAVARQQPLGDGVLTNV